MELEEFEKEQMMKKVFGLLVMVMLFACVVLAVQQDAKTKKEASASRDSNNTLMSLKTDNPSRSILKSCTNERLKVSLACHYSWKEDRVNENMTTYQINNNPAVNLRIVRFNIDILYIQQLSKDRLEAIGQYAKGFAVEDTQVAGLNAIKVKAFSKDDPQTRLLDYYLVHDKKTLYALMFSVTPKASWDNYKFIFQEVIDGFGFL